MIRQEISAEQEFSGNATKTFAIDSFGRGKLIGVVLYRSAGETDPLDDNLIQLDIKIYADYEVDAERLLYSSTITTVTDIDVDNPLNDDELSIKKAYVTEYEYGGASKTQTQPQLFCSIQLSGLTQALVVNYKFKLLLDMEKDL